MKLKIIVISAISLFLVGCSVLNLGRTDPGPTQKPSGEQSQDNSTEIINWQGEKIAFTATGWCVPKSGYEIFIMDTDGSHVQCVSRMAGDDRSPAWSPDGTRLAFSSNRDGNYELYVMNADGTNQVRLTDNNAHDGQPAWSPDGQWIAFSSWVSDEERIYKIHPDGSDLTLLSPDGYGGTYPNWSEDGESIAFSQFGGEHEAGIFIMDENGSNVRMVAAGPLHYPDFSPDGTRIAFDADMIGPGWNIYVINTDGSGLTQLTFESSGVYNKKPVWSPDGTKILFWSDREGAGRDNLYVMNADGSEVTKLTNSPDSDLYRGPINPVWKP